MRFGSLMNVWFLIRPLTGAILFLFLSIPIAAGNPPTITNGESLGILIMGSIVQKDATKNVALIKETKSGKVNAFKRGFTLLNKYRVKEIHEKYMLIVDKTTEYLVYQNKFAGDFVGKSIPTDAKPTVSLGDSYSEDGFERKNGKVKMSSAFRDKIVKQDLAKILMQATAEPFMQNGKIVGFQLSQIDEGSVFHKGGFQDDDIITEINGHKLDSVAGAVSLLKSLKNENQLDIQILRGSSPLSITVEIN